jgi:hypothetical protein
MNRRSKGVSRPPRRFLFLLGSDEVVLRVVVVSHRKTPITSPAESDEFPTVNP